MQSQRASNSLLGVTFVGLLVFELLFIMAARTPLDSDLWWHLAAGEHTLQSGAPLLNDIYSFTRAGSDWINHSWLGEVLFAGSYRLAGWTGVCALTALAAAGSLTLVFFQMSGPPLWRAFFVVLAALVAAPVWSPRPQIFSLVMLALVNGVVLRWRNGRGGLFWLPLLFILWSNLHGGYVLGLILLGCWAAGMAVDGWMGREGKPGGQAVRSLLLWTALCLPAVVINPNGLDMLRIPFQTVGVDTLRLAIPEWASPDFHDLVQQPFLVMLAGLLAVLGLAGKPASGVDLARVVVFTAMALVARRNFGPFAVATLPVLVESGWQVVERLRDQTGLVSRLFPRRVGLAPLRPRWMPLVNGVLLALIGLAALVKAAAVTLPPVMDEAVRANFPAGAVDWMKANQVEGRLFNEYAWGGYLIRSLPDVPVYVDGRTDLYGDDLLGQWLRVTGAGEGWQDVLAEWQIDLVLLPPGLPVVAELPGAGWQEGYRDETSVLFIRR